MLDWYLLKLQEGFTELCIQLVMWCLSVTKPVKGELIIPAGWFPEASVALGQTLLPGLLMDTLITVEAD